jgi:DNA-binding SARP family transcriptional activator
MGSVIRRFRHTCGFTQEQLASAAGLSVGLVRDLEQGRTQSPRWGSVEALSLAMGLREQERAQLAAAWGRDCGPHRPQRSIRNSGAADPVIVRVLGPLAAERSGCPVDLGSVRRKAVLALIALCGEAGVRMSGLTDLLWPDRAPASATDIVQAHVSRLRRLLAGEQRSSKSQQPILWTGVSYRLQSGPRCLLDSDEFVGLVRAGDNAAADSVLNRACEFYERALELWRGSAVADLDCLQEHPLVVDLNRQRSDLVVRYANAAFMTGDPGRALPQLRDACRGEPLSEILHAKLITALNSTGRRPEAVRVFEQLRNRLDQHLGIRPSHLVWRAYGLTMDAAPDSPGSAASLIPAKEGRNRWGS